MNYIYKIFDCIYITQRCLLEADAAISTWFIQDVMPATRAKAAGLSYFTFLVSMCKKAEKSQLDERERIAPALLYE